jgi:PKD repeat protein
MQVALSIPDSTFLLTHLSGDVNYSFSGLNGPTSQYVWDFGDQTLTLEGEQVNHVYASPGNYTVNMIVTDSLGCIAESSKVINVTEGEIQVNIIPNPSVNNPTITHNLPQDEAYTFMLFDATGRKLIELSQPASPFSLETIGFAHGTYWLQCVYKDQKISKGIIRL